MSRRRLLAEKFYQKTEKHHAKFTKKFAFLLALLVISLVMQAFGDSNFYSFLDQYVREELTNTKFLAFFTIICISHVLLHKYLLKHQQQALI